ncbi:hypothetical protein E2320_014458 [Naja naja]|nr:hypothetical protein E2320_014458 [Naja naja]
MIEVPRTQSQPFSPWVPPRFSAPEFPSQHLSGIGAIFQEFSAPSISVQIVSRMRHASVQLTWKPLLSQDHWIPK